LILSFNGSKLKHLNYPLTLLLLMTTIYHLTHASSWAEHTLAQLSRRQKIGQCLMVGALSTENQSEFSESLASMLVKTPYHLTQSDVESYIRDYQVGGVIFLFKSTPERHVALTNHFQHMSELPLLIALDAEWGVNMRLDNTVRYPRAMTLGALHDETVCYEIGRQIGIECATLGIHINFAPVVDVNSNPANPVIHDRSFGQDAEKVARCAILFMYGLQSAGVMACAKHFPGHGDTDIDSHIALPYLKHTREQLHEIELYPFKQLIAHGVDAVMLAHLLVPALTHDVTPTSLSYKVVTQLLKHELNFGGLVITDGLGMEAVRADRELGQPELEAFLAGHDIILLPVDVPAAVARIEKALIDELISEQELDKRVLKILRAKEKAGLHQHRLVDWQQAEKIINDPAAAQLADTAFSRAITIVKNENNLLPITPESAPHTLIVTVGTASDPFKNVAPCCALGAHPSSTELAALATAADKYEQIIFAIAHMNKFIAHNFGIDPTIIDAMRAIKNTGKRTAVILFGTPYALSLVPEHDALMIAFEDVPATLNASAQTLVGLHHACGKLPVSVDSYPAGFGLTL